MRGNTPTQHRAYTLAMREKPPYKKYAQFWVRPIEICVDFGLIWQIVNFRFMATARYEERCRYRGKEYIFGKPTVPLGAPQ